MDAHGEPHIVKHQLDNVFVSVSIDDRICVRAQNGIGEWGKSDHARVVVEY